MKFQKNMELFVRHCNANIDIKNMLKRRNAAKKNNKRSGSEKCDIDFEEEFELINSIDDSMEPDICFGIYVGQHTIKKRKIDALSSEEEEIE